MTKFLTASIALCTILLVQTTFANTGTRGGGDLCEDRIKIIRDDFKSWIQNGAPDGLTLPKSISVQQYTDKMMKELGSAKIRCVSHSDVGFPVLINGTAKICRFDKSWRSDQITCDLAKFMSLNESEQYVLVHHEFAGLAGIENPDGDDSHYEVSNQITGYLVDQVVKKLAVKPLSGSPVPACSSINIKEAREGIKCITSQGVVFERSWRDRLYDSWKSPDGIFWSIRVGNEAIGTAEENCRYDGVQLPSRATFEHALAMGISEVLPDMKDQSFWTSSAYMRCPTQDSCGAYPYATGSGVSQSFSEKHFFRCIGL